MPDHHPRYVVREITGYSMVAGGRGPTTDVWVADTWYCWKEVASFPSRTGYRLDTAPVRRAMAATRCADLNAEHDAWLAAG